MNYLNNHTIGKLALLALLSTASFAQAAEKEAPPTTFATTKVAPGLYMLSGENGFTGGNIGLSIGDDGVVMIDDSMPDYLDKMNSAIKSITPKSIEFLINTHVHGDHTGNNEAMGKSGAHIVAHQNLRKHLLTKGVATPDGNQPAPKDALPVITFNDQMNFHLNGEDAHIFHVAHAHTDGDAVIHFKQSNVIHSGDTFFNGLFPYIDINSGGSVDGYIHAQEAIIKAADKETKIIPGHGPLATKVDLEKSLKMLIDSRSLINQLRESGKTEDEVVALNPLEKYHKDWNWGFITTEKMTRQVYKSLEMSHQD